MRRLGIFTLLIASVGFLICNSITQGHWKPGDDYKMHSPQEPNPQGWDICLIDQQVADDFKCSETGLIRDIHFWISWRGDIVNFDVLSLQIQIFNDVDSQPGKVQWTWDPGDGNLVFELYGEGDQGWHCPGTGETKEGDHKNFYQINITNIQETFEQTRGEIYWLVIKASTLDQKTEVGWKTSSSQYNQPAVWYSPEKTWETFVDVAHDLAFVINGQPEPQLDFGDVPETNTNYPTTLARNGARHSYNPDVFLGDAIDLEDDGQPDPMALGDDSNGVDDEDGVLFTTDIIPGKPATVDVIASTYGLLNAWIDYNRDGDWEESGEQVFTDRTVHPGHNLLNYLVPSSAVVGSTYARFRFATTGGLSYQGAANDGEVEDYELAIVPYIPVEYDQFDFTIGSLELCMPDGTETVDVTGPTTVAVYFEGSTDGTANDDDGDTREEVITEMLDLNLTGLSPTLGPVHVRLNPFIPTFGEIEEMTNDTPGVLDIPPFTPTGSAESFFNLFVEIEVAGQKFYTNVPKNMRTVITHKPPGVMDWYEGLEDIPLVDAYGNETGISLCASRHRPRPPVEIDHYELSKIAFDLIFPDGSIETIQASGPSTMAVYFDGSTEGSADDDDLNGREEVYTEMTQLDLSGFSPTLGLVHVGLHPVFPSTGQIEEFVNSTLGLLDVAPFAEGGAYSVLTLYFEIEIDGYTFLTGQPQWYGGPIRHKPPRFGDCFWNQHNVPLMNAFGSPTGYFLSEARYCPSPCNYCGDISNGILIDAEDLRKFSENWLWISLDFDLSNIADLNCDGIVNLPDYAIFAELWLDTCP